MSYAILQPVTPLKDGGNAFKTSNKNDYFIVLSKPGFQVIFIQVIFIQMNNLPKTNPSFIAASHIHEPKVHHKESWLGKFLDFATGQ